MSAEGDLILNQLVGAVRGGMPTKSVMYVTRAPVSLTRIKLVRIVSP